MATDGLHIKVYLTGQMNEQTYLTQTKDLHLCAMYSELLTPCSSVYVSCELIKNTYLFHVYFLVMKIVLNMTHATHMHLTCHQHVQHTTL